MTEGPALHLDEFPSQIREGGNQPRTALVSPGSTLRDMEKELIRETLRQVQGHREKAARILGIGERTLYRKIKEYGL